ncbi:uncharacterized protein Dwil_GK28172 [Drosophila willistoni]|uniref:Uncharacterized protein n=1 Tax=Drosophila willistoni TaxID=7260 RepID=A0A0Q9WZH6_DROWI|nr:uncharacterized protein Dwil_GK28172 [Drosophila willistoni]
MKALPIVCVTLLVLLVFANFSSGSSDSSVGLANRATKSKKNTNKAFRRACKLKVRNSCSSGSTSCGRFGRSRAYICQLFKNDCQRQLTNCEGENSKYEILKRDN